MIPLNYTIVHPSHLMNTEYSKEGFYLFIFRKRGREGEREGEKHLYVVVSCIPLTGDLAHNLGICLNWESNQQPLGLQACTQSTELYQPGQRALFLF